VRFTLFPSQSKLDAPQFNPSATAAQIASITPQKIKDCESRKRRVSLGEPSRIRQAMNNDAADAIANTIAMTAFGIAIQLLPI
jgi:hypothetical protein